MSKETEITSLHFDKEYRIEINMNDSSIYVWKTAGYGMKSMEEALSTIQKEVGNTTVRKITIRKFITYE